MICVGLYRNRFSQTVQHFCINWKKQQEGVSSCLVWVKTCHKGLPAYCEKTTGKDVLIIWYKFPTFVYFSATLTEFPSLPLFILQPLRPSLLCLSPLNLLPANWSRIIWTKQKSPFLWAFRSTRVIPRQTVLTLGEIVSQAERQTRSTHKHSSLMWLTLIIPQGALVSFKWLLLSVCF